MASVYEQAAAQRAALLKGEAAAAERVVAAYARAFGDIEAKLNALLSAVASGGGAATPAQLARLSQYANLLQSLADANADLARRVGGAVERQQLDALLKASADAQGAIAKAIDTAGGFVPFVQPAPLEALRELVGMTEAGPVSALLEQSGGDIADRIRRELQTGLTAGRDLRKLARDVRGIWGQGAGRALALVRTETLRAYREGSRAAYQANSDVVSGWRWLATRSVRTCPACLALDGREFDLETPMPAHVNCRCTMIPVLRGRDTPSPRQTGAEWFDGLPHTYKHKIVGKAGMKALADGATLPDFVHWREDKTWGRQALWQVPESREGVVY